MPSQHPPHDPFGGSDQGRRQPQDTPDESPTEESETMDTDQDTETFLAYRQHRYGRERDNGRHLLLQVGHGQVEGLPWNWFFEAEPLGIVRRGAIAADIYDNRRNADYPPEPRTASERARAMGIYPEPIRSIWKPIFSRPISPLSKRSKADDRAIAAAICSRIGEAMGWEPVQYIIEDDTPAVPETEAQVPRTQDTTTQDPSQVENIAAPSSSAPRATGIRETRASRRNVPGNNARGSVGSAAFSEAVDSRLEDASEAGTSVPGTSANEESPERGHVIVGREDPNLARNTNVTVGWEIEFLVPLAKGVAPSEILEDGRYFVSKEEQRGRVMSEGIPARAHIAKLLREARIPTIHTDLHDPVQVRIAAAYLPNPEALDVSDPYAVWKVVSELDCMVVNYNLDFDYVGLEFNSRKLPANKIGFADLENALRVVRNNVLVSLTKSCGLHVHVDASVLDLNEMRHFVSIYTTVEAVLFSLCDPNRRGNVWCHPVFEHSGLAVDADAALGQGSEEEPRTYDMPAKLRLMYTSIHDLSDEQQLQRGLRAPRGFRTALNMKLVGRDKYTFEFRHFQSSLDAVVIRQWTRVCLALVMAAKGLGGYGQHPASQVYDVFYQVSCRPEDQAWQSLLRVLGLGDDIGFWDSLRSSYPPPREGGSGSASDSEDGLSAALHLPRVD
ncbi:hypothetical protein VP1G_03315 [Cytospora mali]|uniref:Uncharacterized protein n=1 Tax=Cytospora mali TaxID=578113 RepID=A0A194UWA7_CYTMA|nr:hypothetical protein VP1G_03315 [Valsa mali var. pyri (nom. inval.)]